VIFIEERRKMSRLIDADDLLERMKFFKDSGGYTNWELLAFEMVDASPTVDGERHGHWISDRLCSTNGGTYGVRRCSNCEYYCNDYGDKWNYCPHCGALMDEVNE
jgi:hypothetical protein